MDFFFFQAEDGIRDLTVTGVQTCALPILETVTPAANAKGIRLQVLQDPAGSCVVGDPDRLQQVFWNLLFNRSEERRVGKECRSRWGAYQYKKQSCRTCSRRARWRAASGVA